VATQDTVTQVIGAIRRVRREVPGAAQVIAARCSAHDYDDPGKPAIAWNDAEARDWLVDALVGDAHRLLGHLPEQELDPRAPEAVALLALVAGQDVEPVEGSDGTDGQWRIARAVAADRVISTVDPDSRHVHKSVHRRQDGFKAHVAIEPDTGIVTDCALRQASGAENHEAVVGLELLAGEDPGLQVLGDSAYGTGAARTALAEAGHSAVIKPIPLRSAVEGGFTRDDFHVDEAAGQVSCPAGHTVSITKTRKAVFGVRCRDCPFQARCTTSRHGRKLTLHEHDSKLFAARRQAETPQFQTVYRQHRPMVERSIAWIVRGNRKLRYRGTTKNDSWLHHRVAAVNLRRLVTLGLHHTGTTWAIA
jgi:Transposase DDE domain